MADSPNSESFGARINVEFGNMIVNGRSENLSASRKLKQVSSRHWDMISRRRWLYILVSGTCLGYAARTSLPLTVYAVSKEEKWSKTEAGSVLSSFFWGYTLTQVIGGNLSDRYGGDLVILAAAILWSLATYLHPTVISSLVIVSITRVLMGAAQGVHYPAMVSLTARFLPESQHSTFFAFIFGASSLGCLLSGTLGSGLLEYIGWESVFRVFACMSFVWIYLLYLQIQSQPLTWRERAAFKIVTIPGEEKEPLFRDEAHTGGIACRSTEHHSEGAVPWRKYLLSVPLWACIVSHVSSNYCWFLLLSWMPTYFYETFPQAKPWVFNVFPWLFHAVSAYTGGRVATSLLRRGYRKILVRKIFQTTSQCVQGFVFLLLPAVSSFPLALLLLSLEVAASSLHINGTIINIQDIAPKHAGSIFGIMNTAGSVPGFLGVYLAGLILDWTKSWTYVFWSTSLITFTGGIFFAFFGSSEPLA